MDSLREVEYGEADLAIGTPASLMQHATAGQAIFKEGLPHLRALATLLQNDRMVMAVSPKYNVRSFAELREKKPPIRLATSSNYGTNFIGFVADQFMAAHGIPMEELENWGAKCIRATRPEQCTALVGSGEADALLQEAIMTPWWRSLIEGNILIPLAAEPNALQELRTRTGLQSNFLPSGFWSNLTQDLPALDFSDFVIFVRDDMPEEVAHLLTWCLVETRELIEAQYTHLPPDRSPLTYPLDPSKMAKPPIPLHDGAHRYYREAGHLA